MKIIIEFTGLAREIAKRREVEIIVPERASYNQIMKRIAGDYPALIGLLFDSKEGTLLNSIVLSRNGEEMILPDQMEESPAEGDRLIIVGIIVGG